MSSKSNESEIWKYFRGEYRCYTENIGLARRILSWKSVERGAIYYYPDFSIKGLDFIIRTRTYNRVARVLGLPKRKKSPRRIKRGQRLQESDSMGQEKTSNLPTVEV